jgi:hypothetical protein
MVKSFSLTAPNFPPNVSGEDKVADFAPVDLTKQLIEYQSN